MILLSWHFVWADNILCPRLSAVFLCRHTVFWWRLQVAIVTCIMQSWSTVVTVRKPAMKRSPWCEGRDTVTNKKKLQCSSLALLHYKTVLLLLTLSPLGFPLTSYLIAKIVIRLEVRGNLLVIPQTAVKSWHTLPYFSQNKNKTF